MKTAFMSKHFLKLYVAVFSLFLLCHQVVAQNGQIPAAVDAAIASQLEQSILRRPRAGTPLDRLFAYHSQHGTLEEYCSQLRREAQSVAGQSGQRWCLLGLIESQRGNDFAAIKCFTQAELQLPQDAMIGYYLARSHNYVGNREEAIDALRRSIDRKPSKLEAFPIFELLGTLYLRTQQFELADGLWSRMESMFPGDEQVQDRIIALLASEGALSQAIARCERLLPIEKNANRRLDLELQAAELFAKSGQQTKAIERFESVLARVNPDSWRARDLHRKIEALFTSQSDDRGWIEYAQRRAASHPEDLETQTQLARSLSKMGRDQEANAQFLRILTKAPTNTNIRGQYAEFLMSTHRTEDAVAEFAQLTNLEPNVIDWRIRWGTATARLKSESNPNAHDQAESIWLDIVRNHSGEPQPLIQVANLLLEINRKTKAIELLEQVIDLSPSNGQLIERLGELQLQSGDRAKAMATWQRLRHADIEETEARQRLMSIYTQNGMLDEAINEGTAVWHLRSQKIASSENSPVHEQAAVKAALELAELTKSNNDVSACLDWFERASSISDDWLPTTQIIERWIRIASEFSEPLKVDGILQAKRKPESSKRSDSTPAFASGFRNLQLASLSIVSLNPGNTTELVNLAVADSNRHPAILNAAIDFYVRIDQLPLAMKACEELIANQPLARHKALERMAKLCLKTGDFERAIQLGQQLMEESGLEPKAASQLADLYLNAGSSESAIQLLRKMLVRNPNDWSAHLKLVDVCIQLSKDEEATSTSWRALELSPSLSEQTEVIRRMATIYQQRRRLDDLLSQLANKAMETRSTRLATLWQAEAYKAVRNFGKARELLESLIQNDSLNGNDIRPLLELARAENNPAAVIDWQEKLSKIEPTISNRWKLADAYYNAEQFDKAESILIAIVRSKESLPAVSSAMESLWLLDASPAILALCEDIANSNDHPWPVQGTAMLILNRHGQRELALTIAKRIAMMTVSKKETLPSHWSFVITRGQYAYPRTILSADADRINVALGHVTEERSALSRASQPKSTERVAPEHLPVSTFAGFHAKATAMFIGAMTPEERSKLLIDAEQAAESEDVSTEVLWQSLLTFAVAPEESKFTKRSARSVEEKLTHSVRFHRVAKRLLDRGVLEPAAVSIDELFDVDSSSIASRKWLDTELDLIRLYIIKSTESPTLLFRFSISKLLGPLSKSGRHGQACELVDLMLRDATSDMYRYAWEWCRENKELDRQRRLVFRELLGRNPISFPDGYGDIADVRLIELIDDCAKLGEKGMVGRLIEEYLQYQGSRIGKLNSNQASSYRTQVDQSPLFILPQFGKLAGIHAVFNEKMNDRVLDQTAYFDLNFQVTMRSLLVLSSLDAATKQAFVEQIQTAADSSGENECVSIASQFAAAAIAYWQDRSVEVERRMQRLRQLLPNPIVIDVFAASMEYQKGDYASAIRIAEPLRANGYAVQQATARILLQSSIKAKDLERSRKYAMNLIAIRLSILDQIKLARTLHDLALESFAKDVMKSARSRAYGFYLAELISGYTHLGDQESAMTIAYELLEKNMFDARWSNERTGSPRDKAIEHIKRFGGMARAIERARILYDTTPKNEQFARHLANLYHETGEATKAKEIQTAFAKSVKNTSKDSSQSEPDTIDIAALTAVESDQSGLVIHALSREPTRFKEIAKHWRVMETNESVALRIVEIITPKLSEIGLTETLKDFERSLGSMAPKNASVKVFQKALIKTFGYPIFKEMQSQQSLEWLRDEADEPLISRLLETAIEFYARESVKNDFTRFYHVQQSRRYFYTAELFVELQAREPANFERLVSESALWIEKYPKNENCQLIELSCLVRQRKWQHVGELIRKVASMETGFRPFSFLQTAAEQCVAQDESKHLAWEAMELAFHSTLNETELTQIQLNSPASELYLKLAKSFGKTHEGLRFIKSFHDHYVNIASKPNRERRNGYSLDSEMTRVAEAYLEFDDVFSTAVVLRQLSVYPRSERNESDDFRNDEVRRLRALLVQAAHKKDLAVEFASLLIQLKEKPVIEAWQNLLLDRTFTQSLHFQYEPPYQSLIELLDPASPAPERLLAELTEDREEPLEVTCLKLAIANRYVLYEKIFSLTKSISQRLPTAKLSTTQFYAVWAAFNGLQRSIPDNVANRGSEASLRTLAESIGECKQVEPQELWRFQFDRSQKSVSNRLESREKLESMLDTFDAKTLPASWLLEFALEMAEQKQWTLSIKAATRRASYGPSARDVATKSAGFEAIQGLAPETPDEVSTEWIERDNQEYVSPIALEVSNRFHQLIDLWTLGGADNVEIEKAIAAMVLNPERVWLGWSFSREDRIQSPLSGEGNIEFTHYWRMPKSLAARWLSAIRKTSEQSELLKQIEQYRQCDQFPTEIATLKILHCENESILNQTLADAKFQLTSSNGMRGNASGFEFAMLTSAILNCPHLRSLDETWIASLSLSPKLIIDRRYATAFEYFLVKRLSELSPRIASARADDMIESMADDSGRSRDAMVRFAELAIRRHDLPLAFDFLQRAAETDSRYGVYFFKAREINRELAMAVETMPFSDRYDFLKKEIADYHEALAKSYKPRERLPMICLFAFFRPRENLPEWRPRRDNYAGQLADLDETQSVVSLMDFLVADAKKLGKERELAEWFEATFAGKFEGVHLAETWLGLAQTKSVRDGAVSLCIEELRKLSGGESPINNQIYAYQILSSALVEQLIRVQRWDEAGELLNESQNLASRWYDDTPKAWCALWQLQIQERAATVHKNMNAINSHWLATTSESPLTRISGRAPESSWCVQGREASAPQVDNSIRLLSSPWIDTLFLKYPLQGAFHATFDLELSERKVGAISMGGLQTDVSSGFGQIVHCISPLSIQSGVTRFFPSHSTTTSEASMRCDAESWEILLGKESIIKQPIESFAEAPFIAFRGYGSESPTITNFRIQSIHPEQKSIAIRPSVSMIHRQLNGWTGAYFGNDWPNTIDVPGLRNIEMMSRSRQYHPTETQDSNCFEWKIEPDILSVRKTGFDDEPHPIWIQYVRPLAVGESITYEFFHEVGRCEAVPSIGRTAIHLGPKIGREWLQNIDHEKLFGIEGHYTAAAREPKIVRVDSPASETPIEGEWNRMLLTRTKDRVSFQLNGKEIATETVSSGIATTFGLYCPAEIAEMRIRNASLTGNWPTELPVDLFSE